MGMVSPGGWGKGEGKSEGELPPTPSLPLMGGGKEKGPGVAAGAFDVTCGHHDHNLHIIRRDQWFGMITCLTEPDAPTSSFTADEPVSECLRLSTPPAKPPSSLRDDSIGMASLTLSIPKARLID